MERLANFEKYHNYKIKLFALLIHTQNPKYAPIISQLRNEISKINETQPFYMITVVSNYDFEYIPLVGDDLIKQCITTIRNRKYSSGFVEPHFYKCLIQSIVSKDTCKSWIAYIKSRQGIFKERKIIESFFLLNRFNPHQMHFMFNIIGSSQEEIGHFTKMLKGALYNHAFLEAILKNELFQRKFFTTLMDLQKREPLLIFLIYPIILKLEGMGLRTYRVYANLKNSLEQAVSFYSHEKSKIGDVVISNCSLLIKNGIYSQKLIAFISPLISSIYFFFF